MIKFQTVAIVFISILTISCKNDIPEIEGEWKLMKSEAERLSLSEKLNNIPVGSILKFESNRTLIVKYNDTTIIGKFDYSKFKTDSTISFFSDEKVWYTNIKLVSFNYPNAVFTSQMNVSTSALPMPNQFGSIKDSEIKFELKKIE